MERLRRVRARGDEKSEMAGVNKVHFVVRNNTSVGGEITEGRQYPSNIITPQISLPPSFAAHFQTPPHPSLRGLSDSSTGASEWHTGMSAGSW